LDGRVIEIQYFNSKKIIIMKKVIGAFIIFVLLLNSCGSTKDVIYLQDIDRFEEKNIEQKYEVKILPDDMLSIIISSKDKELTEPFNLRKFVNATGFSTDNEIGFLVDINGDIDYPILGKIHVEGLTRLQLQELLKQKLIENDLIKDPIVTIQFLNFKISVLGEVNKPGSFNIKGDRVTLFEALSMAGDLTIYGKRDGIAVIRENAGKRTVMYVDVRTSGVFNTPYYYLQQNDIVYVEPNKIKSQQSGINQNVSVSAIVSVLSLLTSVAILIFK